MNAIQRQYAETKTSVEVLKERLEDLMKEHEYLLDTGEGIDRYYEIEGESDEDMGLSDIQTQLVLIENAMIAWAKDVLKTDHPDEFKNVQVVFENLHLYNIRQDVVKLAFRLAA